MNREEVAALIKPRDPLSHKGTHGHALILAGNKGRMGAAVLAARACLRTGTGLLTVNVPQAERFIIQTAIPEAMLQWREEYNDYSAFTTIGIGPALGTASPEHELLSAVLPAFKKPMALDADALNLLAQHKELWQHIPAGSILTPHPKEFDRMFGEHTSTEQRKEKALQLTAQYPWIIILKGAGTLVIESDRVWQNTTGNAGLAKGGSGDVLCGMITALLSEQYLPYDAARIGVYLHGLAADIAVQQQSEESLIATDVIECIGKAFRTLQ
jgi:ADP-dependent NAD(P)H-hydrate dehydratase / NAD(P)H-hydrate epimerase